MLSHGVKDVVCSPGSRNTPLILAIAARGELHHHIVVDERAAAFMALGMAVVSRRPVALVCTSGTALLDYAPAIAEAFYQGVPLIVVSADRPDQWIDQDDSQTIRQYGALSNFVKKSYDLPAISAPDEEMRWYANRVVNDAMIEALSSRRGPVHINVRLAPPLGSMEDTPRVHQRTIRMLQGDTSLNRESMNALARIVAEKRVMIVAGFMPPSSRLNRALNVFAEMDGIVVLAETLSNLHLPARCFCVDTLLARNPETYLSENAPELVISFGGALVSRKVKEFLRGCRNLEHWTVGYHHTTVDCFKSLSMRIEADPEEFFVQLAGRVRKVSKEKGKKETLLSDYKDFWDSAAVKALSQTAEFEKKVDWSDFKAYSIIMRNLPVSANLFLSNGTSVRYAQLFSSRLPHASYCNRGVSGIDGCSSTAIGCAKVYKGGLTVLLTGDMSFSYDIGALQLRDVPDTMRIIVVSNGGGGIFRFIPSTAGLPQREQFFCADPSININAIADAFGWRYYKADDSHSLEKILPDFLSENGGKRILEIVTPPELSAEILTDFLSFNH